VGKRLVIPPSAAGWRRGGRGDHQTLTDDTAFPEIIWTFYSRDPKLSTPLSERLAPGIDRGRVNLYAGVDCNKLFPKLYETWLNFQMVGPVPTSPASNPVQVSEDTIRRIESILIGGKKEEHIVLEGDDEDRPPVVEICVGRERELQAIKDSMAAIVFLTGIGGQGKSTLGARYFADCQAEKAGFSVYVWRDCKEESERFENQLASVIERLSAGTISGKDLAKQDAQSIVQSFMAFATEKAILFVFDNVDHYVDLEHGRMIGAPDVFIQALQQPGIRSRVVFTCRPSVSYSGPAMLHFRLEGLSLPATLSLFAKRRANSEPDEIEDGHKMTEGHAFWLDLLAIQVAKPGSTIRLRDLVSKIRDGSGALPMATLNSVWNTLQPTANGITGHG
jgi:hypothetical protein